MGPCGVVLACSLQNPTPYHGVISPSPPAPRAARRTRENSMFCHWGIGANVDVVGAVLGCFWGLLEPSWGPLGVPLGALGGFLGARWAFWGSCWVLLGSPCRPLRCSLNLFALSQAGQRVNRTTVDGSTGNGSTESGSVAGSGAQPLLDNNSNFQADRPLGEGSCVISDSWEHLPSGT